MTNKAGETYPVRVINSREGVTFQDGTIGRALKVAEIHYRTVGNACSQKRAAILTEPFWTKAERVK